MVSMYPDMVLRSITDLKPNRPPGSVEQNDMDEAGSCTGASGFIFHGYAAFISRNACEISRNACLVSRNKYNDFAKSWVR